MSELQHVQITPVERRKYRYYKILSSSDREGGHSTLDSHLFTSGELSEIAAYVEANRARLEQESQEDEARNERAWSADMADMQQIKDDRRDYRLSGDETPPAPPHSL